MSQSVYVAKEKFVAPETVSVHPERSFFVSAASVSLLSASVGCILVGLVMVNLAVILTGFIFGLVWVGLRKVRERLHERDVKTYLERLERNWMESDSFLKMRDFIILLGLNPETAFEVTNSLGVDVLSTRSYSEASGYFMLDTGTGRKAFSAVQIASRLSAKNKIKVTARILQELPD